MLAMFIDLMRLIGLTAFPTRVFVYVLVCLRMLSEAGLFVPSLSGVILA